MSLKTILSNSGEMISHRLKAGLAANNVNASGALSNSIEWEVKEDRNNLRLLISAFDYIYDVDEGKSPEEQRKEDWYELRGKYLKWIKDKKIGLLEGFTSAEDLAAAMVVKTRKEGTVTYRSGQPLGIIDEAINSDTLAELSNSLLTEITDEALEIFFKASK